MYISRIENYTPDLSVAAIRRAITGAFKVWSDVTSLTFTEVVNTEADIMIKFAVDYHHDGYPFDGKGTCNYSLYALKDIFCCY